MNVTYVSMNAVIVMGLLLFVMQQIDCYGVEMRIVFKKTNG
jgi:hypothetical protein